eukprot:CAMPEP_0194775114 /NCGR_PEP_ID=MMETSP0323_2-20130528/59497_1 /TAXON_ID=2866 ORGANISM="Crypthecodinium cohnii, Strain Seligo" /NCGR_SAMPLE_ID=MMETSP0323_2 /ASSEMBLY_ACC=CAM_ASM_000346 /LENGTH=65 /DNA_ID=CAMNT_0039710969 /DNA_START=376 /DNA_END=573 /DNA_ORIENTATION=-
MSWTLQAAIASLAAFTSDSQTVAFHLALTMATLRPVPSNIGKFKPRRLGTLSGFGAWGKVGLALR